jgi:hypothetical protein
MIYDGYFELSFNHIYLSFSTPPHTCVILSEVFQDQGDGSSWALSMMVNALLLFVCDLMFENPRFSSGAGGYFGRLEPYHATAHVRASFRNERELQPTGTLVTLRVASNRYGGRYQSRLAFTPRMKWPRVNESLRTLILPICLGFLRRHTGACSYQTESQDKLYTKNVLTSSCIYDEHDGRESNDSREIQVSLTGPPRGHTGASDF